MKQNKPKKDRHTEPCPHCGHKKLIYGDNDMICCSNCFQIVESPEQDKPKEERKEVDIVILGTASTAESQELAKKYE